MRFCRRCDWTGDDLAGHVVASGHPACVVCKTRSLPADRRQTCLTCLARVRASLARVMDYHRLLPAVVHAGYPPNTAPDKARGADDEARIPGGDALVLSCGGGVGRDETFDTWRESDPPSVTQALATWEDDLRGILHLPAGGVATVADAGGFLMGRLSWASEHHPAFDEMAGDIQQLSDRLTVAVGLADWPERNRAAACFECGEKRLGRDWTDEGLADEWRCGACGRTYTPAEYFLALRAALEREAS